MSDTAQQGQQQQQQQQAAAAAGSVLPPVPQLFQMDAIDVADAWQQELVDSFQAAGQLLAGRSAVEVHDVLQQRASESMRAHGELVSGLVYGILTEAHNAPTWFRQLSIVSRDGFAHAVGRLVVVASSARFARLRPGVRQQLLWTLGELIRMHAGGTDKLVHALLRQMRGGDASPANTRYCRQLLAVLTQHYDWLTQHPTLVGLAAYAFARMMLDHHLGAADLCALEGELVARLVHGHFDMCALVGRDLVRVLQDVARDRSIATLWAGELGRRVEQLLAVPTPRVFLASRLTFDMEARVMFILEHVPVTSYGRNLQWFVQRFMAAGSGETLFADVVRYVCGVWHPSNAVLASSVVPRYVFLGGLLRFVRSAVAGARVKLALFFDWLSYDPSRDSIMNVEPGVLMLARSVDRYAYLTESLVEFLAFVADAYCPRLAAEVHAGVARVMRDAVEKGVVPSLGPVYAHPQVGRATRRAMRRLWAGLVPAEEEEEPEQPDVDAEDAGDSGPDSDHDLNSGRPEDGLGGPAEDVLLPQSPAMDLMDPLPPPMAAEDLALLDPVSRMFHEEAGASPRRSAPAVAAAALETDSDASDGDASDGDASDAEDFAVDLGASTLPSADAALDNASLWVFGETLRDFVQRVRNQTSYPSAAEVGQLVDVFAQSDAPVVAVAGILACALDDGVLEDIEVVVDGDGAPDTLQHVLVALLPYALRQGPVDGSAEEAAAERALELVAQLARACVDVGFRWLLVCLAAGGEASGAGLAAAAAYREYAGHVQCGVRALLARDLGVLQERSASVFYQTLAPAYQAFPAELPGIPSVVRSVALLIDQPTVYRLCVQVARRRLRLFGRRRPGHVLRLAQEQGADAFELVCLWQLAGAEAAVDPGVARRLVRQTLRGAWLDPAEAPEAAAGLLAVLRAMRPEPKVWRVLGAYAAAASGGDEGGGGGRRDFVAAAVAAWAAGQPAALAACVRGSGCGQSGESGESGAAVIRWWRERFARPEDVQRVFGAGPAAADPALDSGTGESGGSGGSAEILDEVPAESLDEVPAEPLDEAPSESLDEAPAHAPVEAPADAPDEATLDPPDEPRQASGGKPQPGADADSRIPERSSRKRRRQQQQQLRGSASSNNDDSSDDDDGDDSQGHAPSTRRRPRYRLRGPRRNIITSDDDESHAGEADEEEEEGAEEKREGFSTDSSLSSKSSPLVHSESDIDDDDF
ncbi:hypothetical protein LPJ53_001751 [Coemansia erecta]|uniref:Integrator complex subunit 3 N-terminal domain-containing protein n=1 Tax=Coemansia erecta TaxID=147472 RepID=A0A9W8CUJ7_9FUNG|nr:hypothetical protein LPJ53_001751 [Coemansia erecta]